MKTPNASILSAEGSPAKTSATPASAKESKGQSPGSGQNSLESLAFFDPPSCSWKTSQRCLDAEWTAFLGTFPRSGTMRSGVVFERPTLARPTVGKGFSSWPTPDASVSTGYNQSDSPGAAKRPALAALAKNWATPRASESENRQTKPSPSQLRGKHGMNLATQAVTASRLGQTESRGMMALNPLFVCCLMGLPEDWVEV